MCALRAQSLTSGNSPKLDLQKMTKFCSFLDKYILDPDNFSLKSKSCYSRTPQILPLSPWYSCLIGFYRLYNVTPNFTDFLGVPRAVVLWGSTVYITLQNQLLPKHVGRHCRVSWVRETRKTSLYRLPGKNIIPLLFKYFIITINQILQNWPNSPELSTFSRIEHIPSQAPARYRCLACNENYCQSHTDFHTRWVTKLIY